MGISSILMLDLVAGASTSLKLSAFVICMNSKVSRVRSAWASGDRIGALRVAARFFDRSADTRSFKRGMDAHNHPYFYRQIGRDPEQILAEALESLVTRFKLKN
jgi:hypothetical protein